MKPPFPSLAPWLAAACLQCAALLLPGGESRAQAPVTEPEFSLHGFASQGYSNSTANNFNSSAQSGGSFDFREAVVNARWRFAEHTSVAAQALYRAAPVSVDDGVRLDYAFLDHAFTGTLGATGGVLLGRFKNPYGFFNETRDVPFTRSGIILPQSMYTERGRPFTMSSQGLLVYADLYQPWGTLGFKGSYGKPVRGGAPLEYILFSRDLPGEFEPDRAATAQLRYDGPEYGRGWSAALSYQQYAYDFSQPRSLGVDDFHFDFHTMAASLQYDSGERWKVLGEVARGKAFDGAIRLGGYLQANYRLRPDVEVFARGDLMILDERDRWGKKYAQSGRCPDYCRYAKDFSVGLNWDIRPDLQLRLEWHHVNGTAWLSGAENDLRNSTERWNLGLAQLSWRF